MLEVRNFSASYGAAPAISGVNLAVAAGMLAVVVGPNGAGKSTLINAIGGRHRPDGGAPRIPGQTPPRRARKESGNARPGLHAVSGAEGKARSRGRQPVGRATANGGDRPRADLR